jgi:uncharacterized cofD-like protein
MSHEIVTVGGGTGSSVVNEALLRTGTVDNINAIAAVYDSGGATGRRRLDAYGKEPAYSDAMRILLSLVPPDQIQTQVFREMKELLTDRDEREKVLGQEIFHRFFNTVDGFSKIENKMRAFGIILKGHVLPSSTEPSNIVFLTTSGRTFIGEHLLDEQRMAKDMVSDMHLNPSVDVYTPAAEAIEKAQLIILSCGSLHGSVLSNFLPNGMKEALLRSKAQVLLVTNLVSTRNETHGLKPEDFVKLVEKYAGRRPNGLIVPEMTRQQFESRYPNAAKLYDLEHSHFLGWDDKELYAVEDEGVQIFPHRATSVVDAGNGFEIVRHDPTELAKTLREKILS